MNLPVLTVVGHERFEPGPADDLGLCAEAWGPMVQVPTFGWWQPSADDLNLYPGRRAELLACCLLVPSDVACADRDRWTVAGRTFEQDGSPHDYNHGPWGMAVPLVVYLSRVEG